VTLEDRLFLHCGLRFRSEIDLYLPAVGGTVADVDIRWGPDLVDSIAIPPGEVIAEYAEAGRRLYTATAHDSGYIVRFPECGEFVISADLAAVSVRRDTGGAHVDLLPVLMAGTVAAIVHGLRGSTLLHASAVCVDGRTLAMVGRSGQGKSTLAGLLCAAGAPLVTDDVLLVTARARPTCIGGASELRLRPSAGSLAASFPEFGTRTTPDERMAVAPESVVTDALPLAAVVIPLPTRGVGELEVVEVPPVERLLALLAFPRIAGWVDRTVLARQFEVLARVAESTPVYSAKVPWGPPFDPAVTESLLDLVRGRDATISHDPCASE
jgi:hypothetical protein